jgi:hypothetical protein
VSAAPSLLFCASNTCFYRDDRFKEEVGGGQGESRKAERVAQIQTILGGLRRLFFHRHQLQSTGLEMMELARFFEQKVSSNAFRARSASSPIKATRHRPNRAESKANEQRSALPTITHYGIPSCGISSLIAFLNGSITSRNCKKQGTS